MNLTACYCCAGTITSIRHTDELEMFQCSSCNTFLNSFSEPNSEADPWAMASITSVFLKALSKRRAMQAKEILTHFGTYIREGSVLDYGCGQGAFVAFLKNNGIDAKGCDISDSNVDASALGTSFIILDGPWELPDLEQTTLISFLDVIEHSEDPGELATKLAQSNVKYVLVKVPMLFGPIGIVARGLGSLGKWGLFERLLLLGEISPHYSFFSKKGMQRLFETRGFRLRKSVTIADVGAELPERLRGKEGEPGIVSIHALTKCVGSCLAAIAPLWSDTRVFLFERESTAR